MPPQIQPRQMNISHHHLLTFLVCSIFSCNASSTEPIDIGSRRELFIDTHLIASTHGLKLTLHHPMPREIAMTFDKRWEGNTSGYPTVIKDGDIYRMIYRGHRMIWDNQSFRMSHSPVVCYAESDDGIHWKKPSLRLFPLLGQLATDGEDPLENNIVWPGSSFSGTFVPFLDSSPDCPPAKRFKAVGGTHRTGLHLFSSPDLIHWTKSEQAIFKKGALDSMNVIFWDPGISRYVIYYRTVVDKMRSISMATSPDLRTWTDSETIEYPNSPRQQMYTNGIKPYYRAPHIRFGFPTRYTARNLSPNIEQLAPIKVRKELTEAYPRVGSDLTDGLFMSSRDGIRFFRWDEAFLRPGPEASTLESNWMYGDNYQSYGLFETKSSTTGAPNEISMLFSEGYWRDGHSRLRRYTIRLDGFVSFQAPYRGGEFITKALQFDGNRLEINYSTSAAGSIRIEIQTPDGTPIDGFSMDECIESIGDSVNHTVRWKTGSDLTALAGQAVRLRVAMKDADIYSLQFVRDK